MSKGKKILTVITLLYLIIFYITYSTSQKYDSEKVLDSKTNIQPTPTPVYTPSITSYINSTTTTRPAPEEDIYDVIKIVDGDTITVSQNNQKSTLRLIGINTPESVDPRRPVECFANEASTKAKELLLGQQVYLEEDPTQGSRDKYNRLLRYVTRVDGLFFNQWMIENGYAYEYTYDTPYKYQNQFLTAQKTAQEANSGLWSESTCSGFKQGLTLPSLPSPNTQNIIDKDCGEFTTQKEAQDFFNSQGGPEIDPHKMDSDRDGVVCESLP